MRPPMFLRVLRATDPGLLAAGTAFVLRAPESVVGRSPDADVVLTDPSVSRRHLRIELGPPLRVQSLTRNNGTFCDGELLAPDTPVEVPEHGVQLQLGGVLLALAPLAATDPVWEAFAPRPSRPPVEVVWDAGQCLIRSGGADLPLNGTAARFFGILAEQPGDVVHHWDLEQELGTPHLAPLASTVRRALAAAHERGWLDLRQLVLRGTRSEPPEPNESLTDLCRRVVQSRRGHGYALQMHPDDLSVQRT